MFSENPVDFFEGFSIYTLLFTMHVIMHINARDTAAEPKILCHEKLIENGE